MRSEIVEISGYIGAFSALYMTKKNCTAERMANIIEVVSGATTRQGFLIEDSPYKDRFLKYLDNIIKYGMQHKHETLLDFIKITVVMKGLHRGAQDDYDAHARRMDIIRTSSRYKEFEKAPKLSDWYKDKVMLAVNIDNTVVDTSVEGSLGFAYLPEQFIDKDGTKWIKTQFGYVKEEWMEDGDALRGLVPLGISSDNTSNMSFRNWRHVYHLRRPGSHAAPELQLAVEEVRDELRAKMPPMGEGLGKVWVPRVGYIERTETILTIKEQV